jgi:hypothetical protein
VKTCGRLEQLRAQGAPQIGIPLAITGECSYLNASTYKECGKSGESPGS